MVEKHGTFNRSDANLADIFYMLAVNFLLYVVLIIVFYMLVRFYLEEETTTKEGYSKVSTEDDLNVDGVKLTNDCGSNMTENDNASISSKKTRMNRSGSFLNINEWGEPEGTKQEVMQRALFCALGLIISFCIWGLVQERMLTQTYNGDFFEFSYGLVFMNRLGGLVLSAVLMYYFKVEWVSSALWEYSFPSVANMLSSWCQYEALKYVSFPVAMLAKAFKMVPVMLMGKYMNNKKYESYEYLSGAVVGFGLYLFIDSSEHIDFRQNVFGYPENIKGAMCGVVLLILFLFFDSFTGQWQTRMFQLNKNMSPLQMMLIMNAFSAVFSFITLVHQEELVSSLYFVYSHPHMILHLLVFVICSTVGQLFIFYTVKNFGAVVFAIIMSVRLLFSTLLSCAVYSHPISELGYLGMIIVFGAVTYRIKRKTEGATLIRWKESEQPGVIFKEWHEHLDI
jgi:adenosine 3'-phospho 5'-phosphosulfate transporter B2